METLKKLGLIVIAMICIIFVISSADLLPGIAIDDIFYVIGAIASFGKIKQINAEVA